jgi:tetratricopeptide (TPR) repeat protein
VNLHDRLRAAADDIAAPACALDVRRRLREVEREYRSATSTPAGAGNLDLDIEFHAALERAYEAGIDARGRGDLQEAAHQLLVAADQQIGDAALVLAEVLIDLGDYDGAQRWCEAAARDGFDEAIRVAERCRERKAATEPMRIAAKAHLAARRAPVPGPAAAHVGDDAERRRFLAHAEAIAMGATAIDSCGDTRGFAWPAAAHSHWRGRTVEMWDVRQTEAATRALRCLDHQYGGANVRSAVLTQLGWAEPMLAGSCAENVRKRLRTALADLHNLAGWVCFDAGFLDPARHHFTRAMDLLSHNGNDELLATVLWRAGRMYLHSGAPGEALKYFQLGELSAVRAGDRALVALVLGCQAWAAGLMDREHEARQLLQRMRDEPVEHRTPHVSAETLLITEGSAYAALARHIDSRYAPTAIRLLNAALVNSETDRPRSRTFLFATLAASQLANEEIPAAGRTGIRALDTADNIRSDGLDGEFRLLKHDADRHTHPAARLLADRIADRLLRRAG